MKKALITGALVASSLAQEGRIHIDAESRQLQDEAGRSVIFHGVNVVYKVNPYIPPSDTFDPQNSMTDGDIQNLKKWGFNFVRLGVMWEAVERTAGVYDDAYLDQVESLINRLGAAGIYTLVDAHQDVLARYMCGEGIPDFYARDAIGKHSHCRSWLLDKLLSPLYKKLNICRSPINDYHFDVDANGDPLISQCQTKNFAFYYTSPESLTTFNALYQNLSGLQDKFISYWDHTSARFSSNKYVVGYDPLNEPYPGNNFENLLNNWPGRADKEYLAPMFTHLFETYQKNSKDNIMWFEPVQMPDQLGLGAGGGIQFPVGFQTPPGGQIGSNKHVLNEHSYCCALGANICASGEPAVVYKDACADWHMTRFLVRNHDAERLGVPLFWSEFGACLTEAPCTQEIGQVTDNADKMLSGWAYWQFKYFQDLTTSASAGTGNEGFYANDGTLQTWKVKALSRSYMMTSQGTPTAMNFASDTAAYTSSYTLDVSIDSPTVLYLNQEYWYPKGYNITVTIDKTAPASGVVKIDQTDVQRPTILITDSAQDKKSVEVSITAK